jgi:putative membrane protein
MLVAGALFGLLWELGLLDRAAGTLLGDRGAGRGVLRQLARAVFDDGPLPLRQLLTMAATLIVLLVVFRLLSAAWMSVTYWGFRLTRSGDDLRCEYGLLTRVASTVPVRRIQKLTVGEGPWHRLVGRVSLQVQTAGGQAGEGGESARTWLAPLVHRSALAELIASILPEAAADPDWQPVHPRGVRREFVGMMVVVVPVAASLAWTLGWWALALVPLLLAWSLFYAQRTVAALRWAVSEEAVHFANGWIWRRVLTAPLTKVQVVSRHEGPFDRRHGMASVSADTAGRQMSGYAIDIPYLAAPVAVALAQRLSAAAARTPFRW